MPQTDGSVQNNKPEHGDDTTVREAAGEGTRETPTGGEDTPPARQVHVTEIIALEISHEHDNSGTTDKQTHLEPQLLRTAERSNITSTPAMRTPSRRAGKRDRQREKTAAAQNGKKTGRKNKPPRGKCFRLSPFPGIRMKRRMQQW